MWPFQSDLGDLVEGGVRATDVNITAVPSYNLVEHPSSYQASVALQHHSCCEQTAGGIGYLEDPLFPSFFDLYYHVFGVVTGFVVVEEDSLVEAILEEGWQHMCPYLPRLTVHVLLLSRKSLIVGDPVVLFPHCVRGRLFLSGHRTLALIAGYSFLVLVYLPISWQVYWVEFG
ncbi:hypothetical protein C8J57DRAFT_1324626 [Mycena rebaudengoi]|nr:hypothetical protein C8J57DRAFT_1324626 [Mycena rebaudengoi]